MHRKISHFAIPLICILFLSGCASENSSYFETNKETEDTIENTESHFLFAGSKNWEQDESFENALLLDADIDWVAVYPSTAKCIISMSGVSSDRFEDYIAKLCDGGFVIEANDKSGIDNGSYTSTNMLLSRKEISINLTYIEENLVLYLGM